ncbi:Predicted arabinose efflux permease, MFS family [Lentzea fradiae]|uniref:Predicted arabinose efflux permease, MFS family n=1 Tax=Lentzea fradiae TaxID=200378 RepID=A0A1G7UPH9_9PSEU|nr:MFS transporter [Lentzea fradiae]SDG49019.1 Predicted arabinose efflux permease, MFS family [Lentzea fradiae]
MFPSAGPSQGLAIAQLTNAIGDGAYYVCSVLFFTRIVGLTPTQVGLGLTAGWALGTFASVPLGHLADRRGPRGVAVLLAVATAVAVAAFALIRSFPAFLVVACVYTICQCGLVAARQALLAGVVDAAGRTKARAYMQSTANAGIAIGAAVGGIALQIDTEAAYMAAFGLDALTFLAAALVLRRLPHVPGVPRAEKGEPALVVLRDRPYAVLTALNSLLMLYMPLLSVVLPLWVVGHTGAPRWMVSALMVINTVSVVLFQVSIAGKVRDLTSAVRIVRLAGLLLLVSCVVFAFSSGDKAAWVAAAVLVAGAVLQVAGEMMLASGYWEISFGLAVEGKQGQYQGFFGSGIAVARMLGPLALTALVIDGGVTGWLVLGAVFMAASLATGPAVAWARRTRPVPDPVA